MEELLVAGSCFALLFERKVTESNGRLAASSRESDEVSSVMETVMPVAMMVVMVDHDDDDDD